MLPRCAVIGGPGVIKTPAGTYGTTGEIKLTVKRDLRDLETALAGKAGRALRNIAIEITAELLPVARYAVELITMQPTNAGESLFGCTDSYLEIHGRDDVKLTFSAGALIKPPAVRFSSTKNLFGEATWAVVIANEADLATLETVLAIAEASFTELAEAYDASAMSTKGGRAFIDNTDTDPDSNKWWGLGSEDGFEIQVTYETGARRDDLIGDFDHRLISVSVTVKFTPDSRIGEDELFTLFPVDGPKAISGTNLASLAKSLRIEPSPLAENDLTFTLNLAAIDTAALQWARANGRVGELTFTAVQGVETVEAEELPLPLYAFALEPASDTLGIGDGDTLGIGGGDTLGIGS